MGDYLEMLFSFFKNFGFWGLGTSFSQLLQLDLQIVGNILKLSPVRCARSTIVVVVLEIEIKAGSNITYLLAILTYT